MLRLITNIHGYYTDERGHIFNSEKRIVHTFGESCKLTVYHRGRQCEYDANWMYLYGRFDYPDYIADSDIRFIRVRHIAKRIAYRARFLRPIWVNDSFRMCASFPKFAVSSDGVVIAIRSRTVLKTRLNSYGYRVVGIYDPLTDEVRDVAVHRLVAEAWVYKHQTEAYPVVNHLDGDKLNNNASNLEWVTHLTNSRKAIASGIKPRMCPCSVTRCDDGKVLNFRTMTDAAAYFGVDVTVFKQAKFTHRPYIFNGQYEVTFYSDYTELRQKQAPSSLKFVSIPIEVMNIETGEITTYSSLREINKALGICRALLSKLLNSEGSLSYRQWRLRRKTTRPWPAKYGATSLNRTVEVICRRSGVCSTYDSITEAANRLNICKDHLRRMARHPKSTDLYRVTIR